MIRILQSSSYSTHQFRIVRFASPYIIFDPHPDSIASSDSSTPDCKNSTVIMPWPGVRNFLMGCQPDHPEDPYITYIRNNNLKDRERHGRNLGPLPEMDRQEWSQNNQQAITDYHEQVMKRHNRDHGTKYVNVDDYARAMRDGAERAQRQRDAMARARSRRRNPHPFFGGPGQPRNRFQETDEEWYARAIDPDGKRREMDHMLGRDGAARRDDDFAASQRGSRKMGRSGRTEAGPSGGSRRGASGPSEAGLSGQGAERDEGGPDEDFESNYDDEDYDDAETVLGSSGGEGADRDGSGGWEEEAEAFLNGRH